MRVRVLHVVQSLLPRSETFVRERLRRGECAPIVLTWKRVEGGLPVSCPSISLPLEADFPGRRPRLERLPRLRAKLDLLEVLHVLRPHVVHAHFGAGGMRVARECRLLGVPLVVSFYGYDTSPRESRGYGRLLAGATRLTVEGPALARRLVELGAERKDIDLLPLALPEWALQAPRRGALDPSRGFRLLQVARFVEKKGVDVALSAVALLKARGRRIRFVLAGDGPLEAQTRALIERLGLRDEVELPGFVPHEELPALFAGCHALVQPSRTAPDGDTEGGAPAVVLEAQAQGLPVVATRHADLPTVVRHGVTGLLCEEDDGEGLAESIDLLIRSPALVRTMGEAARAFTLRRHHPERILRLQERVYRRALWKHAARRRGWAWRGWSRLCRGLVLPALANGGWPVVGDAFWAAGAETKGADEGGEERSRV